MTAPEQMLKPCPNPWCGWDEPILAMHHNGSRYVGCPCGINGPTCATVDDAIAAWNTRPATDELVEALEAARNILTNSGAESGYCMCGDPIESHSFGSGHAPVDTHQYVAGQVIEQIDTALRNARGAL